MTQKEFVTCKCRKIDVVGTEFHTHIGKECDCSMAEKKGKIEKFKAREGILTTLK